MSGQNYFKEQAALDDRLRHQPDPTNVPQYAYFESDKADKKQALTTDAPDSTSPTRVSPIEAQSANRTGFTNFAYPAQPQDQNSYTAGPPATPPPAAASGNDRHASSLYSPVEYVAPRRQWGPNGPDTGGVGQNGGSSRLPAIGAGASGATTSAAPYARSHSPYSQPHSISPSRRGPPPLATGRSQPTSRLHDDSALGYYEEADGRYEDPSPMYSQRPHNGAPPRNQYPTGGGAQANLLRNGSSDSVNNNGDLRDHPVTRSPTASVSSHFTSVSQRGINPRWQPPPPPPAPAFDGGSRGGSPRSQRARNNNLDHLAGFDDFSLPNTTRKKYNPPSNLARHDPTFPPSRGY